MRHFLALRAFKSEEQCFIESDSVALGAEATCLHQAAAVRIPAEPRSFVRASTDGPTQLCVFPGTACTHAQHNAGGLHPEMLCWKWFWRIQSTWSSGDIPSEFCQERKASHCSWWKEEITELKTGLKLPFLVVVWNVILEIARYAADWSYWWAVQTRCEGCCLEDWKAQQIFISDCRVLKQKYYY